MTKEEKERVTALLHKWGSSNQLIEYEKDEMERVNEIVEGMKDIKAVVYSLQPKGERSIDSPVERAYFDAIRVCQKRLLALSERIEENLREKEYIDKIIEEMDFDRRYIIKSKFYDHKSWDEIMKKYPYVMSDRNFYRIYNEALKFINNSINKNEYDKICSQK